MWSTGIHLALVQQVSQQHLGHLVRQTSLENKVRQRWMLGLVGPALFILVRPVPLSCSSISYSSRRKRGPFLTVIVPVDCLSLEPRHKHIDRGVLLNSFSSLLYTFLYRCWFIASARISSYWYHLPTTSLQSRFPTFSRIRNAPVRCFLSPRLRFRREAGSWRWSTRHSWRSSSFGTHLFPPP